MRPPTETIKRLKILLGCGSAVLAALSIKMIPPSSSMDILSSPLISAFFGVPSLAAFSILPSFSTDRILGMQPLTFFCFIIPVVIQVTVLIIWALRWRSPG